MIIFFFSSFLVSCNQPGPANPDYQIYAKIITAFKANNIVVLKYTIPLLVGDPDFVYLSKRLPGLQKDTYDDFIEKYKTTDTLENAFDTKKKVILISPNEDINKTLLSQKEFDGKDIKKIKIQGTTSFSRVGFNKSMNQAIVCDWTQTGSLSGGGYITLFEKRKNKWKLKANYLFGIS